MSEKIHSIIEALCRDRSLTENDYKALIDARTPDLAAHLAALAREARKKAYGDGVFIRGLIEVGNACQNDCLYCGIRKSNKNCSRYRLTEAEILACCREGYALGFRTFVLQGGEGLYPIDTLADIVTKIKRAYPDCALTLSLGEMSRESYKRLRECGADRYLLRHETADPLHYARLHPESMLFENRMRCLRDLKELGYQVGCGFMVGSPYQSAKELAKDLKFIEEFSPDMCGIGPFIPQKDTPFGTMAAGSLALTCYLLSIIRLIKPTVLLPATTALATLTRDGRQLGLLAGANVVMPNLSPQNVRKKYALYDNKRSDGSEAAECLYSLKAEIEAVGLHVVVGRGDVKR